MSKAASPNEQEFLEKTDFIMLSSSALHRYGASADRIENAANLMALRLGLEGSFFSIPTGLIASFKNNDLTQFTLLERLAPGKINLCKYAAIDKTIDCVLDRSITLAEGRQEIHNTINTSPQFSTWPVNFSYAFISFAIAILIGGSWLDSIVSAVLGFLVGYFSETVKIERIDSISESFSAFLVTLATLMLSHYGLAINTQAVILSSLVVLIPGLSLTTALMELASQNLTSGTARFMGAIIGLLKLSFGVFIATQVITLTGTSLPAPLKEVHFPLSVKLATLLIAALGLVINTQADKKDAIWITINCYISFLSSYFSVALFGQPSGSFMAGCAVAVFSNFLSIRLGRPTLVFLLPALILLVPGSVGYKSLNLLFGQDMLTGLDRGFATLAIGVALVSGIYFGNLLLKTRRTL